MNKYHNISKIGLVITYKKDVFFRKTFKVFHTGDPELINQVDPRVGKDADDSINNSFHQGRFLQPFSEFRHDRPQNNTNFVIG